jgi:hypothetical protein
MTVDKNRRIIEEWVPDGVPIRDGTFKWHLGEDVPPGFIQLELTSAKGMFRLWFTRDQFRVVQNATDWASFHFLGERR